MKPGEFIINGVSSLDLDTVIQDRPLISGPVRTRDRREAFGVTGTIIIDGNSYGNSPLELTLYTKGKGLTAAEKRQELYDLFDTDGYAEIVFYFDPTKKYLVVTEDTPIEFETKYYYEEGQSWRVYLSVYPWKYYLESNSVNLTSSGTVNNPSVSESSPIIHVEGSGNIDLKINNQVFRLKGVKSHGIILDSDLKKGYSIESNGKLRNENDKIHTREFLVLEPGNNNISWTGSVNKLTIEPRWRSKV